MASSSRRAATLLLLLAFASSGCWTGRLFEAGRVRESVVGYRGAALDGDTLRLDYTVELSGAGVERREPRSARIRISDMRMRPEHPVDAFPLTPLDPDGPPAEAPPLPILAPGKGPPPAGAAFVVRVETTPAGHEVLRLCPARADASPCEGSLYAAALYRDRTAWWVYPLAPIGAAVDVALLPLQLITTAPFFVAGD